MNKKNRESDKKKDKRCSLCTNKLFVCFHDFFTPRHNVEA